MAEKTLRFPWKYALSCSTSVFLAVLGGVNAGAQSTPAQNSQAIVSALRDGRIDDAKAELARALKANPGDARLWTLDGIAMARSGDAKAALKAYQEALKIAPGFLAALEGAGEIEFRQHSQDAVPLLQKAAEIRPDDPAVHAMLGDLAARRKDCAAATAEFAKSGSLIGKDPVALEQQGACFVRLRKPADAIASFRRMLELRPDDTRARFNLALSQSLAGRAADVLVTLDPVFKSGTADAETLDLAAESYEALGDTPKAVAALRQAIVLSPDTASYYVEFANFCLAHASEATGVAMLNAGLKRQPRAAPLYLARGVLEIQLAQFEKGEEDFATAQQLDPAAGFGAVAAGLAELQQNHFDGAEARIRDHLAARPGDAFGWYLLGETSYRNGAAPGSRTFEQALAAAQKSVQLEPDFSLGRDLLSRLYLQQGDLKAAVEQSRLAFRADPRDQTALYHLILALRKSGDTGEVSALVEKLNVLKEEARTRDALERKYRLLEITPGAPLGQDQAKQADEEH